MKKSLILKLFAICLLGVGTAAQAAEQNCAETAAQQSRECVRKALAPSAN